MDLPLRAGTEWQNLGAFGAEVGETMTISNIKLNPTNK